MRFGLSGLCLMLAASFTLADPPPGPELLEVPTATIVDPPPDKAAQSPPVVKTDPVAKTEDDEEPVIHGPLGPDWGPDEYLLWWLSPQRLPPILTRSRTNGFPIVGSPGTDVVIGGRLDPQAFSGGRFFTGWSIDGDESFGIEGGYFFLGSRSRTLAATSAGGAGDATLGRPYLLPTSLTQTVQNIAQPGLFAGGLELVASSRVQGAEISGVTNLLACDEIKLDGLLGFRFLEINQGLRIASRTTYANSNFYSITDTVDQIDGHNDYFGGQLGMRAEWKRDWAFCEVTGKVALGSTNEVVNINGLTVVNASGAATSVDPQGFFAGPNNSGRSTHSEFAVLSELTARVGLIHKDSRVFIGYNYLSLSRFVQPGDQIDPVLGSRGTQMNPLALQAPSDRPRLQIQQSGFWAQGLMIGAEVRY